MHSCDLTQAFTQSDDLKPDANLYITPPPGWDSPPGTVWKLVKPLYGLAIAPKAWSDTLKNWIYSYGFKSVNKSDTFFVLNTADGKQMHLVFHVDDLLFNFSHEELGTDFKKALLTRFDGADMGPVSRFVGVDIKRDARHTHITQLPLTENLLAEYELDDCNAVKTPMMPGTLLTKHVDGEPDCEITDHFVERYHHLVGTLLYLCTWTRPDLVFATNQLAKFSHDPHQKHMDAARRVLRYLKGTKEMGITYTQSDQDPNRLIGFADADWAACTETRRSVSGFVCLLNGGAVQWRSRQQMSVATSTSEAEWVAASRAADELVWLGRVMAEAGFPQATPTPLYEDNRSCRMMSENPVANDRSKHIDYRVHALRERVQDGHVRLLDCPTYDMLADPFTKALDAVAFARFRDIFMGINLHTAPPITTDLNRAGPRTFAPRDPAAPRPTSKWAFPTPFYTF